MKKGYDIILSLRYTTTLKIESEKEDEEEIKEDARQCFIQDVLDVTGARDLLELCKVVEIKRNYSESTDAEFKEWAKGKKYEVEFNVRSGYLTVTVSAVDEIEAVAQAEEELETCFTSEDGKTECEAVKYEYFDVDQVEEEKED